jgi:hypothetical protein
VLLVVFGLLFDDDRTEKFVATGLSCLGTGAQHAIPTALLA